MKNIRLLLSALVCLCCLSCADSKLITRNNVVTLLTREEGTSNHLEQDYKLKNNAWAKIDNKGDYSVISELLPTNLVKVGTPVPIPGGVTGFKTSLIDKYYAPNSGSPSSAVSAASEVTALTYWDGKPVLQGISTVLKIRPKLDNYALKDSFPSQAETGFSPALAFGWKFSRNTFLTNKDLFGRNIRQLSITPGVLLGVGGVDLTKNNTRAPKIEFPRKALFISRGGFLSLGYNNINLGYAWGKDYATGEGSKGWLYRGETWHAIVFGFDIIK
ncbi:hypothetical protein [Hymenobacter crusticola]|uniref:Outer membrane protein beta-barrel domain-containing protein n=1 Tax=Hymenobacter crusticola TaxID=1770526 RepID=A0A243W557_9BACT|nr:hypothetical protein [Hymenobacter crusticola]OUJ66855.1 hypothetical protein BXP70_28985 [Hymenobacter crusticola]